MSNVISLSPKPPFENTSKAVLQETTDMNPDTVIVFAFIGGQVHIRASGTHSNLELMGALEAAKQHVWSHA